MKITATTIPDVLILEPQVHGDHRGFFMETWRKTWFKERGSILISFRIIKAAPPQASCVASTTR